MEQHLCIILQRDSGCFSTATLNMNIK